MALLESIPAIASLALLIGAGWLIGRIVLAPSIRGGEGCRGAIQIADIEGDNGGRVTRRLTWHLRWLAWPGRPGLPRQVRHLTAGPSSDEGTGKGTGGQCGGTGGQCGLRIGGSLAESGHRLHLVITRTNTAAAPAPVFDPGDDVPLLALRSLTPRLTAPDRTLLTAMLAAHNLSRLDEAVGDKTLAAALESWAERLATLAPDETSRMRAMADRERRFEIACLTAWYEAHLALICGDEKTLAAAHRRCRGLLADWPDGRDAIERARFEALHARLCYAVARHPGAGPVPLVEGLAVAEAAADRLTGSDDKTTRQAVAWLAYLRARLFLALGEADGEPSHLANAHSLLRAALAIWSREETPRLWARARAAMGALAEVRSEDRAGAGGLAQALAIYEDALAAFDPGLDGRRRGETALARARVLLALAVRTGDIARRDEAIAALREIMATAASGDETADLALPARLFLADALISRADMAALEEAAALLETESDWRAATPSQGAARYHDLGEAFLALGRLQRDSRLLARAGAAFEAARAALGHDAPLRPRLQALRDAGRAWMALARQRSDTGLAERAARRFGEALALPADPNGGLNERADLGVELHSRRAAALVFTGRLKEGSEAISDLEAAVADRRRAARLTGRERTPMLWAKAQDDLGRTLALLAAAGGSTPHLEQAAMAFGKALEIWTVETAPERRAGTLARLGHALADHALADTLEVRGILGRRHEAATRAFTEAYDIFAARGLTARADEARRTLVRLETATTGA